MTFKLCPLLLEPAEHSFGSSCIALVSSNYDGNLPDVLALLNPNVISTALLTPSTNHPLQRTETNEILPSSSGSGIESVVLQLFWGAIECS